MGLCFLLWAVVGRAVVGRAVVGVPKATPPSWLLHFRDHAACRKNCRLLRSGPTGLVPWGPEFLVIEAVVAVLRRSDLLGSTCQMDGPCSQQAAIVGYLLRLGNIPSTQVRVCLS